jgi:hypothetical protein
MFHESIDRRRPAGEDRAVNYPSWGMNLRHAAALALVGWYLITPPSGPAGKPDFSAPLSEWGQMATFDSAAACKKEHDSEFKTAEKWLAKNRADVSNGDDLEARLVALAVEASRCVAADDLKSN